MTWRKDHLGIELADSKPFAILEQPVPLRSVGWKGRPIVDSFPERLNTDDMLADAGRRTGVFRKIPWRRNVVSMRMSVKDPFNRQAILVHIVENHVGAARRCRSRRLIKIEHGIDDDTPPSYWIGDDVLDATCPALVEAFDIGLNEDRLLHGCLSFYIVPIGRFAYLAASLSRWDGSNGFVAQSQPVLGLRSSAHVGKTASELTAA